MSKETKPRYELHRQSDTYVTLGDGDHRLCSICIKKTRGVLDAQLILLVMNSHKDLLAACETGVKFVANLPPLNIAVKSDLPQIDTRLTYYEQLEAAINNAKPKAEKEAEK